FRLPENVAREPPDRSEPSRDFTQNWITQRSGAGGKSNRGRRGAGGEVEQGAADRQWGDLEEVGCDSPGDRTRQLLRSARSSRPLGTRRSEVI
ncbi:MAG: hypothetical protein ACK56I_36290, partial [bacterium]